MEHITKIEGHAKLNVLVENNKLTKVDLDVFESARFFESLVLCRRYDDISPLTSRICGICSSAHVIAAISAIEDALQYTPTEQTKQLRLLLTLGERIRSHATHLYFLALPDYLGYESALAMAGKYKDKLEQALRLMKAGNTIVRILGARDLHPVSATIGGWLKLPRQEDIQLICDELRKVRSDAIATCELFLSLKYPHFITGGDYYSLVDKKAYAVLDGIFTSSKLSFAKKQYFHKNAARAVGR